MAFDGNGTYNRIHDWTDDLANTIPVTASRMDTEDDGFATGLSTCVTKDGQTTITANLPMSGFEHTGVGNAAARDSYLAASQYQDQSIIFATSTGSTNAYVLTLSPAITAYAAGQRFSFKANFVNTGSATLNVSGVGAKTIKKNVTETLASGDIPNNSIIELTYDGTDFQLNTLPAASTGLATVTDKTANFTLTQAEAGTVVRMDNAAARTFTLPETGTEDLLNFTSFLLNREGAGTVTIAQEGTDTINNTAGSIEIATQFGSVLVIKIADGDYMATGDIA